MLPSRNRQTADPKNILYGNTAIQKYFRKKIKIIDKVLQRRTNHDEPARDTASHLCILSD